MKLAILLIALFSTCLFSSTYYVTPKGTSAGSGTISSPWNIAKANTTLQKGDTVLIRKGVYKEMIEPKNSGEQGFPIVYSNYPNEEPSIVGKTASDPVVKLRTSYIVIQGLRLYHEIRKGSSDIVNISFSNTHHNKILNCNIISPTTLPKKDTERTYIETGINIDRSDYNIVQGNTIRNMTKIGVHLTKGARFNKIINNRIIDIYQDCVHNASGLGVLVGTLIENNILGGSVRSDGVQFNGNYDSNDLKNDVSNRGVIIRNNVIYNCSENAIDLKGTSNIVIEGNTIYGCSGDNDGLCLINKHSKDYPDRFGGLGGIMHGAGASSKDVIIRNNTIYDNNGGIQMWEGWKCYNNTIVNNAHDYTGANTKYVEERKPQFIGIMASGSAGSVIKNNIVGDHPVSEIQSSGATNIDYNIYFNSWRDVKLVHFKDKYKWDTLSLDKWKDIVKGEKNSKIADPLFVNVPSRPIGDQSKFDFAIKKGSPCIDAGTFLTVTTQDGSGTKIRVKDAGYFYNGFEVTDGDLIQLEAKIERARVLEVDYASNTLTVDKPMNWKAGTGIALAYNGSAPDIGAYEFGGSVATINDNFKNKSVNNDISITTIFLNNSIAIDLNLTTANSVGVAIYDINGRLVKQLFSGFMSSGSHKVDWNREKRVVSGLYFFRVKMGNSVEVQKINLTR